MTTKVIFIKPKVRPPRMSASTDVGDPFGAALSCDFGYALHRDVLEILCHPDLSQYYYSKTGPAIWFPLILNVPFHADNGGLCLAYCARGAGTFYTVQSEKRKLKVVTEHISAGYVLIFDDRLPHSFEPARRTDLLVFNVREKK